MKYSHAIVFGVIFLILILGGLDKLESYAQSPCPNDNNYWNTDINPPPCQPGSSTMSLGVGTFGEIFVKNGVTYVISTCGSGFDTKITGYISGTGTDVFDNDDNGPACSGIEASVEWTSTFDGIVWVLMDTWDCDPCTLPEGAGIPTDCPAIGSAVLTYYQKNNLVITSSSAAMCSGESRTLTATPSGGTFSGTGITGGSLFTAPNNTAPYTITYTLGQCAVTQTIDVTQSPTVTIDGDAGFCQGGSTLLTANASAGSGFISTYQWKLDGADVGIDPTYNANQHGDYIVVVSNSGGCIAESAIKTVSQAPGPAVTAVVDSNIFCAGTGGASVSISGGAPPYFIMWSNGENSATITGLATPGTYSVTVIAADGCTASDSVVITSSGTPVCSISGIIEICLGDSTIFTASGGGSYSWSGPGGFAASGASTGYITVPGEYMVTVENGGCVVSCSRILVSDSCIIPPCVTQDISILEGWNIISSYIDPDTPDMLALVNDIAADIVLIKNVQGNTAIPTFGINTIGDWIVEQGYKLKSLNPNVLSISCQQVDPLTTPIYLSPGWSIISYLRTTPMNTITALASLDVANVAIVKNLEGKSYIPAFGINTIGEMIPGQGYTIKMLNPDTLIYPANLKMSESGYYTKQRNPSHFTLHTNTGHNATIIVPVHSLKNIEVGDEIGVFNTDDQLAGSAVYEGSHLAITVWGDDPVTGQLENMQEGEEFVFKLWRAEQQKAIHMKPVFEDGGKYYHNDGISVMKKLSIEPDNNIQEDDIHIRCYPNPTNGLITFRIETADQVEVTLNLYDMVGKIMAGPLSNSGEVSEREIVYNASELPAGLYFYKAEVNGRFFNGSFVVNK